MACFSQSSFLVLSRETIAESVIADPDCVVTHAVTAGKIKSIVLLQLENLLSETL